MDAELRQDGWPYLLEVFGPDMTFEEKSTVAAAFRQEYLNLLRKAKVCATKVHCTSGACVLTFLHTLILQKGSAEKISRDASAEEGQWGFPCAWISEFQMSNASWCKDQSGVLAMHSLLGKPYRSHCSWLRCKLC